ncbi:hypothetical protein EIP86_002404, partial [Pleurotus ostreatoroseus]
LPKAKTNAVPKIPKAKTPKAKTSSTKAGPKKLEDRFAEAALAEERTQLKIYDVKLSDNQVELARIGYKTTAKKAKINTLKLKVKAMEMKMQHAERMAGLQPAPGPQSRVPVAEATNPMHQSSRTPAGSSASIPTISMSRSTPATPGPTATVATPMTMPQNVPMHPGISMYDTHQAGPLNYASSSYQHVEVPTAFVSMPMSHDHEDAMYPPDGFSAMLTGSMSSEDQTQRNEPSE